HLFKKEASLPSVVNTKSLFLLKVALRMATATSSDVIILFSSLGDSAWVEPSANKAFFRIFEAVNPGQATSTWTPFFITSVLRDSKKPFMAYLLAVYAVRAGVPRKPLTEEIAMIDPLFLNISSMQYLVAYTDPQKLVSITLRNTSKSRS